MPGGMRRWWRLDTLLFRSAGSVRRGVGRVFAGWELDPHSDGRAPGNFALVSGGGAIGCECACLSGSNVNSWSGSSGDRLLDSFRFQPKNHHQAPC